MKYFAVLTSIILVFISMYFIYLAINSEYIIISVLRFISALVTIYLALPNFKENKKPLIGLDTGSIMLNQKELFILCVQEE